MQQQHLAYHGTNVTQSTPNIGTHYQYPNQQIPLEQSNFYQQQGDNQYLQATSQSAPGQNVGQNQGQAYYPQHKTSAWDMQQAMQSQQVDPQLAYQNYQAAYTNQGQIPQGYTEAHNNYYSASSPANQLDDSMSRPNTSIPYTNPKQHRLGVKQPASAHGTREKSQQQSNRNQTYSYANMPSEPEKKHRGKILSRILKEEKEKHLRNGTQPTDMLGLIEESPRDNSKSPRPEKNQRLENQSSPKRNLQTPQYNQNQAQMYQNPQYYQNDPAYQQASFAQPNISTSPPQQMPVTTGHGQISNQAYTGSLQNLPTSQNAQGTPQQLAAQFQPQQQQLQYTQGNIYQQDYGQAMQTQLNEQQMPSSNAPYQTAQAVPQTSMSYSPQPTNQQMTQRPTSAYGYYQTSPQQPETYQSYTPQTVAPAPTTMQQIQFATPALTPEQQQSSVSPSGIPQEYLLPAQTTAQPQTAQAFVQPQQPQPHVAPPVEQQLQLPPQITSTAVPPQVQPQGVMPQNMQPASNPQLSYQQNVYPMPGTPIQSSNVIPNTPAAQNVTHMPMSPPNVMQPQQQVFATSQPGSGTGVSQPQLIQSMPVINQQPHLVPPNQSMQNLAAPVGYNPQVTQYTASASNIPINATHMQPNPTQSQPNMSGNNYVDPAKYIPYQNPHPEGVNIGNPGGLTADKSGMPPQQVRYASNDTSPAAARQMSYAEKPFNAANVMETNLGHPGHVQKLVAEVDGELKNGYPAQAGIVAATPAAFEENVSASPKLERPRSLSIQPSEDHSDEKNANDIESEIINEENIDLDNVDNDLENLTIEIEEKIETKVEEMPDNKSTGKRTPSHLTEQGFLDLKFYHSKLW